MAQGVDTKRLGNRFKRYRKERECTLEKVHEKTGISISTLSRIERGAAKEIESATLLALAKWMKVRVDEFTEHTKPPSRGSKDMDTPEIVELHLRADKKLNKEAATLLATMFRSAYEELSKKGEKG